MIAENYGGGPVGVETLSAALSESRDAIEEVIEPYLLQQGLIARTPAAACWPPRAGATSASQPRCATARRTSSSEAGRAGLLGAGACAGAAAGGGYGGPMIFRKLTDSEAGRTTGEKTLLAGLSSGEIVARSAGTDRPGPDAGPERQVRAGFLRYLLLGGCEELAERGIRVHEKGVEVERSPYR